MPLTPSSLYQNLLENVGVYCLNARRIWAGTPQIADDTDERGS